MYNSLIYDYKKLNTENKKDVQTYLDNILKNNLNCINFQDETENNVTILILSIELEDYSTTIKLLRESSINVDLLDDFNNTAIFYVISNYIYEHIPFVINKLDTIISLILKNTKNINLIKQQIDISLIEFLDIIRLDLQINNIFLVKEGVLKFVHILSLLKRHIDDFDTDNYYYKDIIQHGIKLIDEACDC
jgi:hypothetical protein